VRMFLATFLFLGFGLAAHADTDSITLTASSSRFFNLPGFSFSGVAQCDSQGNLYFHSGLQENESLILELRADGSHAIYTLPATLGMPFYFVAFRVDFNGKLWLVAGGPGDEVDLFEFHDDSREPSRTRLDASPSMNALTIHNFVVLQNRNIVLQGYFDAKAPAKRRGHSYLAEFDASGKLVRNLVDKPSGEVLSYIANREPVAAAAQGENGLSYLLEPDKVLVMSQTGKVVRKIALPPPEADFHAYQLYMAKGRLAVAFSKTERQPGPIDTLYALFDASTGERLRVYRPGPETGGNLVCFSDDGFTFYRVEQRRVKLVTATVD
jgi:hypothetical protein